MNRRTVLTIVAGVTALAVLIGCALGVPALVLILQNSTDSSQCGGTVDAGSIPSTGPYAHLAARQVGYAVAIVAAGKQAGVPPAGYVVALAVALQESGLKEYANANVPVSLAYPHDAVGRDHDSVGLFQQRPSPPEGQGSWGSVAELMTPSISAAKFYSALVHVPGWQLMSLTEAAQAVQRSAYPGAYAQWAVLAAALAAHVLGISDIAAFGGGDPAVPCRPAAVPAVPIGASGWVRPLDARYGIVSPYGPRGGVLHAGVDLSGPGVRGQPIRAAASGVVEVVACQSSIGTCDRDGGLDVAGCGWYVDIRHAGAIVTRYCHQGHRPYVHVGQTVTAGQVIGVVGASGNVTGPHLHFEVHIGVPPGPGHAGNANSVDPVPFMSARGVTL